jgi:hypothetical protein
MAAPWDYANSAYLNLKATLNDGTVVTLKIDRYLNNGLQLQRNTDAGKAKDALLSGIAGELKVAYPGPLTFTIDGQWYDRLKLQRVFSGKGAPEDIRNVVRLASRFKLTDATTVGKYCTKNIGMDCNGFAGNFWGINPDTWIGSYNVDRRKEVADVTAGDAMIFYPKAGGDPYHIAVVDEVKVHTKQFEVVVAQSMGPEVGIHSFSWGDMTPQKNAKGELFTQKYIAPIGDTIIYYAGGPEKGKSAV